MTVAMRLLPRRNRRALPPIDEAAAYARCHGERGVDILRVEAVPPPPPPKPRLTVTGETLRAAFEARLRAREGQLLEVVEERDAVREEQHGDDDREAGQVPLDDVGAALGGGREAHAAHARVAAAVHQHERDEDEHQQDLDDGEEADHGSEG
jgi:hypothetical protein